PTPALGDYYCNERTYDGHKGTDIFTWPFPWFMYENDLVEVIAGEEGVIINKADGFEDDHCECFGSWNAIYIQHADGSVAWYGHMKSGSLTDKEVGDAVSAGEFLGVVASSGCSSGPHLHLEVYDAAGDLIDPYAGDCNDLNADSWWEAQADNREPTLNTILTHDAVPEHGCPTINEDPHMSNDFYPGDLIYTAFYFHDGLEGTELNCRLKMPDGTIWNDWDFDLTVTYNKSWWYWSWYLPEEGPFGVWTLEADYQGETIVHEFNYGVYANLNELDGTNVKIIPNPSNTNWIQILGVPIENKIDFYDATGKHIKSISNDTFLDIADLAAGLYYVNVHFADGRSVVKKFVKN
ncbi:MAG: peptidoglycan DD-metalloendopeptidase family protein, partial [Flavobacteriaceae bacterium]|nr:peptidoglycan DD-metalloendopeptidase family protein [Flavobacteriaceae bacterium]